MFFPLKFGLFNTAFIEFGPNSHSDIKVRKLVDFENTFEYKLGVVVVHGYISSTQETEVGGPPQVQGQPGVQRRTLSMSRKKNTYGYIFLNIL